MLKNRVSAVLSLVLAAVFSVVYLLTSVGPFSPLLFEVSILAVITGLVVFINCSQNSLLKGNWVKPSNLFVIGYLAVNFQSIIDYQIGLKNSGSKSILYPNCLNLCLILGVVGLLAFVAGYAWINRGDKPKSFSVKPVKTYTLEDLRWPLIIAQLIIFVAFLATIDINSFITGLNYGSEDKSRSSFEGLFHVVNSVIVLFAMKHKSNDGSLKVFLRSFPRLSLIIIGLYMVLRLLSGDRGPFIYTGLLLFYGYSFVSRKKYKLWVVLVAVSLAAIFVSVVGIARNLDRKEGFLSRIVNAREFYQENGRFENESSILPMTEELGFSFIVNQIDVNEVEVRGARFNYGKYTLFALLSGIPYVPSLLSRTFHVKPEDFTSSGFANYYYFGGYERDWGIGTTIIGDFYLQLGVLGVLIGLFITGLVLRWIDWIIYVRRKESIGLYLLLFVILVASMEIYIPRANLLTVWPTIVHASIVLFFLLLLFRHN